MSERLGGGVALAERQARDAPASPVARVRAGAPGTVVAIGSPDLSAAELLLSRMLETLLSFVASPVALGLTIGEWLTVERVIALGARRADVDAAMPLITHLPALEPIDPFNPRRADASRAHVMWAGLVGGHERLAGSMYGRHLRHHGYGPPVVAYCRREGRIEFGLLLLRRVDERPFDTAEVGLLTRLHPFLQAALAFATTPVVEPPATPPITGLTAREAEIARFVAGGLSNADIAVRLGLSEATVKAHLTRVYAKLDVRTRTQLAMVLPRLRGADLQTAR